MCTYLAPISYAHCGKYGRAAPYCTALNMITTAYFVPVQLVSKALVRILLHAAITHFDPCCRQIVQLPSHQAVQWGKITTCDAVCCSHSDVLFSA
jgi:hypothetical protein